MSVLPPGVCLELPLRVENVERAIDAVGGAREIARVTAESSFSKEREGLELRLRNDHFHHPVTSMNLKCNNIVIEIDVPKSCMARCGGNVKSALTLAKIENTDIKVRPVLHVNSVHRFRGMADFQYYTRNSAFASKMNVSVLAGNLAGIQGLSFDAREDARTDILPPPRFSVNSQPFYYAYKQSAYLKVVNDDQGMRHLVNTASTAKVISNIINWGDSVPDGPPEQLLSADISSAPRSAVKACVAELEALFEKRPSYTRRALQHLLGSVVARQLKFALPYVSYYYRSGPWRGAYIKYGVDPSQTKALAKYQVEYFRITGSEQNENDEQTNHDSSYIFDGTSYPDAPMLQLCDIEDGILENYINTESLRDEADENDGWYDEQTIGIIRRVLRQELIALKEDRSPLSIEKRERILRRTLESRDLTS